jgi:hypothetical protein
MVNDLEYPQRSQLKSIVLWTIFAEYSAEAKEMFEERYKTS